MGTEGELVAGRYRLDQPIGRGRAGIVWLAYDIKLNRTVAAKRMYVPPGLDPARAEQARAIAFQEGQDATRVVHGCVITVHEAVLDGGQPWLVMEYVPSRNMADFLGEHGQLTPEQASFLGIQLATALTAAHNAGLAHRSVEPGNVLLADDGGVKVTDFGISGAGASPAYRAPEVARGQRAGSASDAFSLGATLYTAVEGVPPFGEQGTGELRSPQRAGALTGALLKLLRADPTARPTMADTIASLQAITQGRQSAFIPPTAPVMPTIPAMPRPPLVQQPPPAPRPSRAPMDVIRSSPKLRMWILTVLAILTAAAIGIGIAELLFV
ncbi:serine/threonine-protein kinase [Amycolatopsis nigrescens]|uniref:serine/threonine-protein kinase n=1 Tax=Amycolatopsis nigrescens TaxID=381445 RepID=UPI00035C6312|nr:serine/threonine-protein kinase [Amycolatopsis nigrescens]